MPKNKKDRSGLYIALLIIIFLILAGVIVYCLYWTKDVEEEEQVENEIMTEENEDEDNNILDIVLGDKEDNDSKEVEDEKDDDLSEEPKDELDNADEDSNEVRENVYVAVYGNAEKYSVEYPDNWKPYEIANKNEVGFIPPGNSPSDEYAGDITISYKENPEKISIDRHYDGLNDVNLFEDASGGFENKKVGDYEVYKFKDVIGYMPSTVAVIVLDDAFIEIIDVQNKHQNNNVFESFIETFKEETRES